MQDKKKWGLFFLSTNPFFFFLILGD